MFYGFDQSQSETQQCFYRDGQLILISTCKCERHTIFKTTFKEKNKVGRLTVPDYKNSYKAMIIKTNIGIILVILASQVID